MKKNNFRKPIFNFIKKESMILAKKNRILAVLMAAVVVTGLSSCLKNNNNNKPEPYAYAFFANVATPQYKITILQNNQDLTRGNGLEFGKAASGQVNPGPTQKFDFKRLGSDTLLTTYTRTYDTLYYYTSFVYGSQANGIKSYNFREDFSNNETSKAHVRFYNMVEDSDPVTFSIGTTALSSSRMFEDFLGGSYNDLIKIEPNTVDIIVKNAAGTELDKVSSATLNARGVYSIMYVGTKGDTGNRKPKLVVFSH